MCGSVVNYLVRCISAENRGRSCKSDVQTRAVPKAAPTEAAGQGGATLRNRQSWADLTEDKEFSNGNASTLTNLDVVEGRSEESGV